MKKIDLSVLVLEGDNLRNLHKLLLNIDNALTESPKKISYEILVADSKQRKSYLTTTQIKNITAIDKTHLLKSSNGKIVAIFEEDSLVTPAWIPKSISLINNKDNVIVHTEVTIFTPKKQGYYIWKKADSTSEDTIISLSIKNQWDYPIMAAREYIEDSALTKLWHFTEQTITQGISHIVTPETTSFNRSHPHTTKLPFMTFSPLYEKVVDSYLRNSVPNITARPLTSSTQLNRSLKETLRKGHVWMKRHSTLYKSVVMPILKGNDLKMIGKKIAPWAINDWKIVHQYDRTTFPTRDALRAIEPYTTLSVNAGLALKSMLAQVKNKPDYLYLSQHMMKGGGDKVVLNYIKAMQESRPDWKLMLIITEEFDNNWKDRVPKSTQYIDFWQLSKSFDITTRYIILMRFIVQMQTKKMLLAMTPFGFETIEHYQEGLIENSYQIDSVAFCIDTDSFGRTWGIHFFGIPETFSALHKVVTDNQHVIDETLELEPLSRDKFSVHYQPVEYVMKEPVLQNKPQLPIRILWASRVANQKRPDIVIKIAQKLDPNKFIIDMYGNLEDEYLAKDFDNIPALNYMGGFNGLNSLPTEDYRALLYTSSFDGVPNILLEATALGLPLIAPNVGGVSEFVVNKETGLLIEDIEHIEAFVDALEYVSTHPEDMRRMVANAQKRITMQHSYEGFKKAVEHDIIGEYTQI